MPLLFRFFGIAAGDSFALFTPFDFKQFLDIDLLFSVDSTLSGPLGSRIEDHLGFSGFSDGKLSWFGDVTAALLPVYDSGVLYLRK